MSAQEFPVTVAVQRPDGSVEHVRVGTAVRVADSFRLTFGALSIGTAPSPSAPSRAPAGDGGLVFPPYGRSKGAPIAGASVQDLEFYASGCRRTLGDAGKARWHDKERQLLAAIEAELTRQGRAPRAMGPMDEPPPSFRDDDAPPRGDEDIPF